MCLIGRTSPEEKRNKTKHTLIKAQNQTQTTGPAGPSQSMRKNCRFRSEMSVFDFWVVFFFSWVNKILLKRCRVIYVWMHYSEVLLRVLRTQARFLSSSGCSAQSQWIALLSNATRAFQTHCAQTARADICETKIKPSQRLFIKILNLAQSGKSSLVVKVAPQSGAEILAEPGQEKRFHN